MKIEASKSQLEILKRFGAATTYDVQAQKAALDPRIAPLDPRTRMVGRAITIDAQPGDNLILHYAVTKAKAGDVIVVDAKGYLEVAVWGDILTLAAKKVGVAGLVIDGAVRDAAAMVDMGFPVFCRGLAIRGPTKSQPGNFNVPIVIGGCVIRPGDIIVGDRDGLVVVAAEEVNDVIGECEARERKEALVREGIEGGATTVSLFGLEEALKKFELH